MITKTQVRRTFYKILDSDGETMTNIKLRWSLPVRLTYGGWHYGMWHIVHGPLIVCVNCLHVTRGPAGVAGWLGGETHHRRLFACEVRGDYVRSGRGYDYKRAYREVRLVREVVRGSREWKLALAGTDAENWQ